MPILASILSIFGCSVQIQVDAHPPLSKFLRYPQLHEQEHLEVLPFGESALFGQLKHAPLLPLYVPAGHTAGSCASAIAAITESASTTRISLPVRVQLASMLALDDDDGCDILVGGFFLGHFLWSKKILFPKNTVLYLSVE